MPLIQGKSKQAFGKNVAAERNAGKPMKQSLAIAYNIKRKNSKKMSNGGMVPEDDMGREHDPVMSRSGSGGNSNMDLNPGKTQLSDDDRKQRAIEVMNSFKQNHDDINNLNNRDAEATYSLAPNKVNYGRNEDDQRPADHEMPDSAMDRVYKSSAHTGHMNPQANAKAISDAIMQSRKSKMLAEGGMVDDDTDEMGDDMMNSLHEPDDFLSHDADMEAFPGDHSSNEHGDEAEMPEEDNKKATLARILADIRSRHMGFRKS